MFVNNVTEGWKHLQSVKEEQLKKQVYQNTCIILGCEVATLRNPFFSVFLCFLLHHIDQLSWLRKNNKPIFWVTLNRKILRMSDALIIVIIRRICIVICKKILRSWSGTGLGMLEKSKGEQLGQCGEKSRTKEEWNLIMDLRWVALI